MTRILLAVVALLVTLTPSASAAPVVDVLVLYTPKALADAGGEEQLKAIAARNAAWTNKAFVNSHARARTRIAAVRPAPEYNPAGKEESTAAYDYVFATPASVATLRDSVRADVIDVVAADVGGFSTSVLRPVPRTSPGVGSKMLTGFDEPEATFAHELGHLLGLAHDKYVGGDGQGAGYTHARGYVAPSLRWRTIMAYVNKCRDAGVNCPDIQYYSNPKLSYQGEQLGQPIGSPEQADEVAMLNESAPIVAAYR